MIDTNEYRLYRKKASQPMRPYIPGENMEGISIGKGIIPEEGGMIAVNPTNPRDMWYIEKEYFNHYYIEV